MKTIIPAILLVSFTVLAYSGESHFRTGGGPELKKIKVKMLQSISNINAMLEKMIGDVNSADTLKELIAVFEGDGLQIKAIIKKMYQTGQKYEDEFEKDKDFMKAGEDMSNKLYTLSQELEDAISGWKQGHALSDTENEQLQKALDKFYEFDDPENDK